MLSLYPYSICVVNTHETKEEAIKEAEKSLDLYRDEACESGWSDEVDQICWGEIRQAVKETMRRSKTDEDHGDCDEIVDYGLVDRNGEEDNGGC